jgi:ABC-type dipeptide/oligopeptide/nickel transport system ATPase component
MTGCHNDSIAGRRFSAERNRRIAVVGTTGSGKTALARRISQWLDIPHVELDALYWGPHWTNDSIFLWALRTYPRRRREYPSLLQRPAHAHLAVVHLHSPRAARDWLARLG